MKLYNRSLYMQARDEIMKIVSDSSEFMTRLPSEQELSEKLGVSRNTIREAIKVFESEGILIARQGVGTFVIHNNESIKSNIANLESHTSIISNQGYRPGTRSASCDIIRCPEKPAKELHVPIGSEIFYLDRVRTANDKPVVYVEDYMVYEDEMEKTYSLGNYESLLDFLEHFGYVVCFAVCSISACISSPKIMGKLALKDASALLHLSQTHYSVKGEPALYSDSFFLCDDFEFNVIRKAIQPKK